MCTAHACMHGHLVLSLMMSEAPRPWVICRWLSWCMANVPSHVVWCSVLDLPCIRPLVMFQAPGALGMQKPCLKATAPGIPQFLVTSFPPSGPHAATSASPKRTGSRSFPWRSDVPCSMDKKRGGDRERGLFIYCWLGRGRPCRNGLAEWRCSSTPPLVSCCGSRIHARHCMCVCVCGGGITATKAGS